jgi:hypothetical protein
MARPQVLHVTIPGLWGKSLLQRYTCGRAIWPLLHAGGNDIKFDIISTRVEQRPYGSSASVSLKQRLPPKSWDSQFGLKDQSFG